MGASPFHAVHEPHVIDGHPTMQVGDNLLTVCATCGEMRSILFLSRDRWLCTKCRAEGATAPNLYPIS